ncbi:hypothetical protein AB5J49_04805 [Streptomyces sp. R28]|uniref:Uncharacterized protein n=1 Tax=Streptomyces sp. R28 TaxID=3238628 RepID=A0AB39PQT2_9ACTN
MRPTSRRSQPGPCAHSDGVDVRRAGQRVWIYGARSQRPFGTVRRTGDLDRVVPVDVPERTSRQLT